MCSLLIQCVRFYYKTELKKAPIRPSKLLAYYLRIQSLKDWKTGSLEVWSDLV